MTTRFQRPPEPAHYPTRWHDVADVRVLKAKTGEWHKLSLWRADMTRRGWSLLKVTTTDTELMAVFGKTKVPQASPP
ncbi:MAG: hypothetical protein O7E49_11845 [Gemmatimonadetes bacterium]|nr:hypothetical protein [Gemmatimonadota bacterium]